MTDREDAHLAAIAKAAEEGLRASVSDDEAAIEASGRALMEAASQAMAAGRTLAEIAAAEQRGHGAARDALRAQSLKLVERTTRRVREAEADHQRAIVQATKLGLSTREVAGAAGVTHGTIRAIWLRATRGAEDAIGSEGDSASQDVGDGEAASDAV